jgi:hypothetical protein
VGKQEFSRVESYKKLENPHAKVHNVANQLATECTDDKNGATCSKEKLISMIKEIENASKEVFVTLDNMVEQKSKLLEKEAIDELFPKRTKGE